MTRLIIASIAAVSLAPNLTSDPLRIEQTIAKAFVSCFKIKGLPFKPAPPTVIIKTTPGLSYYDNLTVTEGRFDELPPAIQTLFSGWARAAGDGQSGKLLFEDMFYRFFFVHEMGHWATHQVLDHRHDPGVGQARANVETNPWQAELVCNRMSVAWWREHNPAYLRRLVDEFRRIIVSLPNPVPSGMDEQRYFAANYEHLGQDPQAYGWFLLRSVMKAYDEPPRTFQHTIDTLPTEQFDYTQNQTSRQP